MDSETRKVLDQRWSEYETLARVGEYYAAMLRVAEICSVTREPETPPSGEHEGRCHEIEISAQMLDALLAGIRRQEERLRKVVAFGDKWNEDEIMLVLTIRIQNDLLLEYLRSRGVDAGAPVSMSWDDLVEQFSPGNARELNRTLAALRRNWGLPIRHKALSTETTSSSTTSRR